MYASKYSNNDKSKTYFTMNYMLIMNNTNNCNKLINNIFNDLDNFMSNISWRCIQHIKQHMINNFVSIKFLMNITCLKNLKYN